MEGLCVLWSLRETEGRGPLSLLGVVGFIGWEYKRPRGFDVTDRLSVVSSRLYQSHAR